MNTLWTRLIESENLLEFIESKDTLASEQHLQKVWNENRSKKRGEVLDEAKNAAERLKYVVENEEKGQSVGKLINTMQILISIYHTKKESNGENLPRWSEINEVG
ncbi:hypothetical protein GGP95_001233 [Salinibacter ruber]|nr:hypothetical protein [Salinibacter ruber]